MSLAGRIDAFPIPEVLRLLALSEKTGSLRVEAGSTEGELFLQRGKLTYGTTRHDDSLRDEIVAAGLIEPEDWPDVERREKSIADVLASSKSEDDLEAFVRELIIDVVFRLQRHSEGGFEFEDGAAPPYETGRFVDVEVVLAETEVRVNQWRDIESVIPGVTLRLRMATELTGHRDVTLTDETWRMLAALEGAGSITDVAARTGSTDFQVGKVLARLVQEGLVEVVDETPAGRNAHREESYRETSDGRDRDDERYGSGVPVEPAADEEPTVDESPGVELLESVISDVAPEDEEPERRFRRRRGVGSLDRTDP
jgi:hypothetical protein